MKYTRTKDKIIVIDNKKYEIVEINDMTLLQTNIESKQIFREYIVSQADTIEELCDGFIITSKQGHIYDSYGDYNYELKEVLPQAREECPDEDWDLYGCILVNGIIKQVAKLNAKGVLELL